VKMFDAGKTGMIGLPYGEKTMTICNVEPFSYNTSVSRTDGQTDRISLISRVSSSMLTRDKNVVFFRKKTYSIFST